jgi:hypothetical protein
LNGRQLAQDAGIAGVVVAVVTGGAIAGFAVGGVVHERDQLRTLAARPRPAATRTVTAAPTTVPPVLRPSPTPEASRTLEPVAVRSGPGGAPTADGAGGAPRPQPTASSPSTPAAPDRCDGRVLIVRLFRQCAITVGGSR